ncbi:purine nucleoside permease [Natronococcus amylolyticus DSM 10524]|uniref:Purine nucleoside permease n=1 Tax=Natronococcus amylolyticus DSM 10524 TaxID=1227497 RepID=L9XI62_9EURY|nr:purine nucleoside permease [Natronococcus amylolyticus DSM 10524]
MSDPPLPEPRRPDPNDPVRPAALVLVAVAEPPLDERRPWLERADLVDALTVPGADTPIYLTDDGIAITTTGIGKSDAATTTTALLASPGLDLGSAYVLSAGIAGGPPSRAALGRPRGRGRRLGSQTPLGPRRSRRKAGGRHSRVDRHPRLPPSRLRAPTRGSAPRAGARRSSADRPRGRSRCPDLPGSVPDRPRRWADRRGRDDRLRRRVLARPALRSRGRLALRTVLGLSLIHISDARGGDEFWHGPRYAREVDWLCERYGVGPYATTQMEDAATATALERFGLLERYLSVRAVANYDRSAPGETVEESFDGTEASLALAIDNAERVGSAVVEALLEADPLGIRG